MIYLYGLHAVLKSLKQVADKMNGNSTDNIGILVKK